MSIRIRIRGQENLIFGFFLNFTWVTHLSSNSNSKSEKLDLWLFSKFYMGNTSHEGTDGTVKSLSSSGSMQQVDPSEV